MLEQLIKNQADPVVSALQSQFGLPAEQARQIVQTALTTLSGFLQSQIKSGQLNAAQLADLFNKETPNETNALFGAVSEQLIASLSKLGLEASLVQQLSRQGLDLLLKKLQEGPLGNVDQKTIESVLPMLTGGKSPLGGMLGGLGNLFKR